MNEAPNAHSVARDTAPIPPRYLSYSQAGQYLGGLTPDAVRMMCARGLVPFIKQGSRTFIDRRDLDAAMQKNKVILN